MIEARIGLDGRMTVPVEVREALGLQPGDAVSYEIDGDRIILSRGSAKDEHGPDWLTDEELQPIIEEALAASGGPTYSSEEVFAELRAHIEAKRRRADVA